MSATVCPCSLNVVVAYVNFPKSEKIFSMLKNELLMKSENDAQHS